MILADVYCKAIKFKYISYLASNNSFGFINTLLYSMNCIHFNGNIITWNYFRPDIWLLLNILHSCIIQ